MKFKVGQKVVCKIHHPDYKFGKYEIKKDTELTIRSISKDPKDGSDLLLFEEINLPNNPLNGLEYSYDPDYFAPLIKSDQFIEMTYTKILETTHKVSMS